MRSSGKGKLLVRAEWFGSYSGANLTRRRRLDGLFCEHSFAGPCGPAHVFPSPPHQTDDNGAFAFFSVNRLMF